MNISNETLQSLKDRGIKIPEYDRKSLKPSIVHIGLGHFHRSHFLTYMDELLRNGDYDGGVFEVDIIPSRKEFIDSLRKQDYLYSVLSIAPDGKEELRINGPIVGYANHAEDPESVMACLSSPETTLITLTITEKGYCYRDDIGSIDWENADIRHDIETSDPPRTAIGCLAEALSIRCRKGLPVTIMSCDNVPENGKMLRSCMLQFCRKKYPEIAGWVENSVAFPCTMVDRITPGTSAEDILKLRRLVGIVSGLWLLFARRPAAEAQAQRQAQGDAQGQIVQRDAEGHTEAEPQGKPQRLPAAGFLLRLVFLFLGIGLFHGFASPVFFP